MTSYKLHYAPFTASLSVHWLLVHLELHHHIKHTVNLVSFEQSEQKQPEYLALNPKGRVPTLVVHSESSEDFVITESAAILLYLAEQHPEAHLAPSSGSDRAKYLETVIFLANTLLPCLRDYLYAEKDGEPGQMAEGVKALAERRRHDAWDLLDKQLEGREYLVGGLSVADFLLVSLTEWFGWLEDEACKRPNLGKLVKRMKERDDWKEVTRREQEAKAKL